MYHCILWSVSVRGDIPRGVLLSKPKALATVFILNMWMETTCAYLELLVVFVTSTVQLNIDPFCTTEEGARLVLLKFKTVYHVNYMPENSSLPPCQLHIVFC